MVWIFLKSCSSDSETEPVLKLLACVTCMITSSSKAQEWSLSTKNKSSQCPMWPVWSPVWSPPALKPRSGPWAPRTRALNALCQIALLSPTSLSHRRAAWFSDRPTSWARSGLSYYLAGGEEGHRAYTICLCPGVHRVSPNQTITRTERDQAKVGRKVYHEI